MMVNSPAPAWTAVDENGSQVSLSDYSGKWLVLYFYPEDDTPGCTIEACGLRDRYQELLELAQVVGVSADSSESHKAFKEKYALPFTLIADTDRSIIQAYGAVKEEGFGSRVTFIIDPHGIIRHIFTGIECTTHAAEVIETLKELGARTA